MKLVPQVTISCMLTLFAFLFLDSASNAETLPVDSPPVFVAEMISGVGPFIMPIDPPISPSIQWKKLNEKKPLGTRCCTIAAKSDVPVRAMADGIVLRTGWYGGYGKVVIMSHRDGYTSLYGHMTKCLVSPGQEVKQGWLVGLVGSTGFSTQSHLLFEIRKNGKQLSDSESLKNVILTQQQINGSQ